MKPYKGIYIARGSKLNKYVKVGKGTRINGPCFIMGVQGNCVEIGNYCAIGHNLRVRSRNHSMNYANVQDKLQKEIGAKSLDDTKGGVSIGNAVWIGDNVTILSGVNVGDGAVIGAGSVVTKNVKSYSVVAGVPAKFIKMRFTDEIIEILNRIKWWSWSEHEIQSRVDFFNIDLTHKNASSKILESLRNEL
ncbi:MAG: CatB-related O-acetyltransferase [Kangiella sp.]|nr:CatB-related O-acetyltransferase [Kangiella sp.]